MEVLILYLWARGLFGDFVGCWWLWRFVFHSYFLKLNMKFHIFGSEFLFHKPFSNNWGHQFQALCNNTSTSERQACPTLWPKRIVYRNDADIRIRDITFSAYLTTHTALILDRQDRQSPIASDFRSQTHSNRSPFHNFDVSDCWATNLQSRVSNRRGIWGHESLVFKSLAILDLDRAGSRI